MILILLYEILGTLIPMVNSVEQGRERDRTSYNMFITHRTLNIEHRVEHRAPSIQIKYTENFYGFSFELVVT